MLEIKNIKQGSLIFETCHATKVKDSGDIEKESVRLISSVNDVDICQIVSPS